MLHLPQWATPPSPEVTTDLGLKIGKTVNLAGRGGLLGRNTFLLLFGYLEIGSHYVTKIRLKLNDPSASDFICP